MSGWDQAGDVDSWNADVLEDAQTCIDLPRSLAELRDGIAPPAPNAGAARQARIERMQHEIAVCADFVADCDRYRDHLAQHPLGRQGSCLTPLVPHLMHRHLDDLRQHAVATGRRLRDELQVLSRST